MQRITSKDNEYIKHIKKLKDKKYRDMNNEFLIEGIKIVKEAIQEKASIKQIIICEECEQTGIISKELLYEIAKYECIYVTQNVFKNITGVINPQGILAVIEKKDKDDNDIDYSEDVIVVLDDIQDPGNLGTILRTVDSIGLKQIVVSKGTADAYNPKVVRSTMGAIFRVNVVEVENVEEAIIGNEANGVEKNIIDKADEKVKIPMPGKTESLNASVATGIVLYEYVRQKGEFKK